MNIPPKPHIKILQGMIAQDKISREDLAVLLERPVSDIYKRLDPNQTVDFSADEIRQISVWLGNMGYLSLAGAFVPSGVRLRWQDGELIINGSLDDELKHIIRHFNEAINEYDKNGCTNTMTNHLNKVRYYVDQAEAEVKQ